MVIKTETTVCDRNHIFVPLELLSGAIHRVKKPIGPNNGFPRLLAKEGDKQGNKVHA
jgi:hypothetical protein